MPIYIDENNPLSNKYPCHYKHQFCWNIDYDGITFPTAESAFQATRFVSNQTRRRFSQQLSSFRAEYEGRRMRTTVPDWENMKYDLMYKILRIKFLYPELRAALLDTGSEELVIINMNHEHEWGTCRCQKCRGEGRNNLGKMLMQLRDELSQDKKAK